MIIDPQSIEFRDVTEASGCEDTVNTLNLSAMPDDYPQGANDFDEHIYPGFIHVAKSKVGGWPT